MQTVFKNGNLVCVVLFHIATFNILLVFKVKLYNFPAGPPCPRSDSSLLPQAGKDSLSSDSRFFLLLLWISISPGLMWPFAFPNKIEGSALCAKFRYCVVFLYAFSANNASQLCTSRNIICSVNQPCGPANLPLNLFQDSCGEKLKYYSHFQGVKNGFPGAWHLLLIIRNRSRILPASLLGLHFHGLLLKLWEGGMWIWCVLPQTWLWLAFKCLQQQICLSSLSCNMFTVSPEEFLGSFLEHGFWRCFMVT